MECHFLFKKYLCIFILHLNSLTLLESSCGSILRDLNKNDLNKLILFAITPSPYLTYPPPLISLNIFWWLNMVTILEDIWNISRTACYSYSAIYPTLDFLQSEDILSPFNRYIEPVPSEPIFFLLSSCLVLHWESICTIFQFIAAFILFCFLNQWTNNIVTRITQHCSYTDMNKELYNLFCNDLYCQFWYIFKPTHICYLAI